MVIDPAERASELFDAAKAKSDAGDEQAALSLYLESLALDRESGSVRGVLERGAALTSSRG
jgi:hypothetical protein